MATAAQLKRLRKKYGLGEFKKKSRSSMVSEKSRLSDAEMRRIYGKQFFTTRGPGQKAKKRPARRRKTSARAVATKAISHSLLAGLWRRIQTSRSAVRGGVYLGAGGAQSTTTFGSSTP